MGKNGKTKSYSNKIPFGALKLLVVNRQDIQPVRNLDSGDHKGSHLGDLLVPGVAQ